MSCQQYRTLREIDFDASKYVYNSTELASKFNGSSSPMKEYKSIYVTLRATSKMMSLFLKDMQIRANSW